MALGMTNAQYPQPNLYAENRRLESADTVALVRFRFEALIVLSVDGEHLSVRYLINDGQFQVQSYSDMGRGAGHQHLDAGESVLQIAAGDRGYTPADHESAIRGHASLKGGLMGGRWKCVDQTGLHTGYMMQSRADRST